MYSTATTGSTAEPCSMPIDKVLAVVAKLQSTMCTAPEPNFSPVVVRDSPLATRTEPVKAHKHRHAQTEAYHKRIQKKWTTRYGTKQVPCAYMIDNAYLGGFGRILIAHPSLMVGLR